jgi:hypothetical protein
MDQIAVAAKMAGDWWAERLADEHADKREAFAQAVAARVDDALRGKAYWSWGEGRKEGDGEPCESIYTEVDYDPQGLMLDAVRETIAPDCRGMMFSARGILPQKHQLRVAPDKLTPKEGYGNWTAPILVPNVQGDRRPAATDLQGGDKA